MALNYGWEKLFMAVTGAASDDGSLQARLAEAYLDHIRHLRKEDVPSDVWGGIERLREALNAHTDEGGGNRVQASVDEMTSEDAGSYLEQVVSMFNQVSRAYFSS